MTQKLIIANWKMYPTLSDSLVLASQLKGQLEGVKGVHIVLAPPTAWLASIVESWTHKPSNLDFAIQNIWPEDQGAYTGEVSAYMVKSIVKYALVGHSERRRFQSEDDELVREKVQACLRWKIRPIVCIGEHKRAIDAEGRVDSYQLQRVMNQLTEALHGVKGDDIRKVIIAYEPVWAITQGATSHPAKPAYAEAMIRRIRDRLAEKYGKLTAEEIQILYGGSVNTSNASEYLRQQGVNGLLVGEISVKAKDFVEICRISVSH